MNRIDGGAENTAASSAESAEILVKIHKGGGDE